MQKKKVIITGIDGQDGQLMTEYLSSLDVEILGTSLKSTGGHLNYCDITDREIIENLIKSVSPDYFINFAGQSVVSKSFENPAKTFDVNVGGVINILEAIKEFSPACRFFNASSVDIFSDKRIQNEESQVDPKSIYAASKSAARDVTKVYRDHYNIYAVSGILSNHESVLRPDHFLSKKIAKGVAQIIKDRKEGRKPTIIKLENLGNRKDWGYAPDFMDGIWRMLNQADYINWHDPLDWKPTDYVLSTGKSNTVYNFVWQSFKSQGIHVENNEGVISDKETGEILATGKNESSQKLTTDPWCIKRDLDWEAKTEFEDMVKELVDFEVALI